MNNVIYVEIVEMLRCLKSNGKTGRDPSPRSVVRARSTTKSMGVCYSSPFPPPRPTSPRCPCSSSEQVQAFYFPTENPGSMQMPEAGMLDVTFLSNRPVRPPNWSDEHVEVVLKKVSASIMTGVRCNWSFSHHRHVFFVFSPAMFEGCADTTWCLYSVKAH